MVALLIGLVGNLTAIIGWFGFHSLFAVLGGTLLYFVETVMEWRDLNLNAKMTDIVVFVIGAGIGFFINSMPWYICGLLVLNIYGFFCLGVGLITKMLLFR